jgi:hypothetical protein
MSEELTEKEKFTKIVNHASKNERIAWNRKHKKLVNIIAETITPLEERILELTMEKMTAMDAVVEMRDTLRKECVHPREFLVSTEDCVKCRFCERDLKLNV